MQHAGELAQLPRVVQDDHEQVAGEQPRTVEVRTVSGMRRRPEKATASRTVACAHTPSGDQTQAGGAYVAGAHTPSVPITRPALHTCMPATAYSALPDEAPDTLQWLWRAHENPEPCICKP